MEKSTTLTVKPQKNRDVRTLEVVSSATNKRGYTYRHESLARRMRSQNSRTVEELYILACSEATKRSPAHSLR